MKKGFTLIEMLVVVLIIGILAGIALPQYNKAVWKARFAEVYTVVNALEKSIESYMLSHDFPTGYYWIYLSEELDIDVLSSLTKREYADQEYYCSKYICYHAVCTDGTCRWVALLFPNMSNDSLGDLKIEMQGIRDSSGWFRLCWYEEWDIGKHLCESTNWDDIDEGF